MSEVFYDYYSIGIAQSNAKLANKALNALEVRGELVQVLEQRLETRGKIIEADNKLVAAQKKQIEAQEKHIEAQEKHIEAQEKHIEADKRLAEALDGSVQALAKKVAHLVGLAQEHANAFADERSSKRVLIKMMQEHLSEEDYARVMGHYQGEDFVAMFRDDRKELIWKEDHQSYFGALTSALAKEGDPAYTYHPFVNYMRANDEEVSRYEREYRNDVEQDPRLHGSWARDENYAGERMINDIDRRIGHVGTK